MIQYLVDKESLPSFTFNGYNSKDDLKIIILKSNHLSSPSSHIQEEYIPGRRGKVLEDEGGYDNLELKLECALDAFEGNITEQCRLIKKCLKGPRDYSPLVLSEDPDCYLEAVCVNKLDIEEVVEHLGEFEIYFSCKPYRKIASGEQPIVLNQAGSITNPGEESEPLIEIKGSGDITLTIADQEIILKTINQGITLDCEELDAFRVDNVTKKLINENGKMFSDFPRLREGINNISWTGNITEVKIIPRWVVI